MLNLLLWEDKTNCTIKIAIFWVNYKREIIESTIFKCQLF